MDIGSQDVRIGIHDFRMQIYGGKIAVSKTLYPASVVLKSAYNFIDSCYIHIDDDGDMWVVWLEPKTSDGILRDIKKSFENELVSQAVRLIVYERTRNIREMMLARALSSSMAVVRGDEDAVSDYRADDISDEELDGILTSWFDSHVK